VTAPSSAPDPAAPAPAAAPPVAGDGAVQATGAAALESTDTSAAPAGDGTTTFAQRRAEAAAHAHDTGYAGLATRALAFAVDAAVVNGIALFVGVVVGLGLSLFDIPKTAQHVLVVVGAALTFLWLMAYFVLFWAANGQTPGNRLMEIRVQDRTTGRPIPYRRALLRVLLLELSAILLFTPALLMLVDSQRRALHDRVARTVVVYAPRADDPPRPRSSRS
jgi:uncharacterized RDD family membrane protein YckC